MQFRQIIAKRNAFQLYVTLMCLFMVWSCGPVEDSASGTGTLSFNIVYHDSVDGNIGSMAAEIDCVGKGVATVEAKVYGSDNDYLAGGGPWNCDNGQGTISSVPAGSGRTVVILGKDVDDNVVFSGQKSDIDVIANNDTDAGIIECYDFVPNLLAPADGAVVRQDAVVLEWEDVAGATDYRVLVSQNNDMSDPVIDDSTTANDTPSGLSPEILYYWQVFAIDSDGNTGSGSQIWSFAITASAGRLPDTGQEQIDGYTPVLGEDMTYTINPPSHTKLDTNGIPVDADWTMVRDEVTGLIWEVKTDDGTIHDKDNTYNWQDAQGEFIDALNDSNFGGYDDWRVPTVKELAVIVNRGNHNPAINTEYFPNAVWSSDYWSATQYATGSAWKVSFDYGGAGNAYQAELNHVRAVRGRLPMDNLVDNGDGTVTDTVTGLMWQQLEAGMMTWREALNFCETLELAGYDDWRLPNINELQSIVDYEQGFLEDEPAIDTIFFPNAVPGYYWSATTFANSTGEAWKVDFNLGKIGRHDKSAIYYVRAVRAVSSEQ